VNGAPALLARPNCGGEKKARQRRKMPAKGRREARAGRNSPQTPLPPRPKKSENS